MHRPRLWLPAPICEHASARLPNNLWLGPGWAPGAVSDWQTGASGWILWVSLAIMLGDSLTSLSLLCANSLRSAISHRHASPCLHGLLAPAWL